MLLIRVDGNKEIGSGHIMRCLAIAQAACMRDAEVIFVVSDERSASIIRERSCCSVVLLGGNPKKLESNDGLILAKFAEKHRAHSVVVDSYAVSHGFFDALASWVKTAYIDDTYLFANGFLLRPMLWNAHLVINYGFGVSEYDYAEIYRNAPTALLIGPRYAPVLDSFVGNDYKVASTVKRVLVTSGSTNPNYSLEKMILGCNKALKGSAVLDVVVGPLATLDERSLTGVSMEIHRSVSNMSALMSSADIAVSASGSTLYELSCIGVPTIALPIVQNQRGNVEGFKKLGVGMAHVDEMWDVSDVAEMVSMMADNLFRRKAFSERARKMVDGCGAARLAEALLT